MADDTQQPRGQASAPEVPTEPTSASTYRAWMLHVADCQPCEADAPCQTGAVLYQDYREARIS